MSERFNQFGDCIVPGQEGRHVTEFENADLTLSELKLKLAASEEERDEEGTAELKRYIRQRELQYVEPASLENKSAAIVQQRLREAGGSHNPMLPRPERDVCPHCHGDMEGARIQSEKEPGKESCPRCLEPLTDVPKSGRTNTANALFVKIALTKAILPSLQRSHKLGFLSNHSPENLADLANAMAQAAVKKL
jgi:hypothetical protein